MTHKRKIIVMIFLMAFNLFLLSGASNKVRSATTWECNKVYNRPGTISFYDDYRCKSGESLGEGDLLFSYYGEDAQCWEMDTRKEKMDCQEQTPFGGAGTFQIGGNYIMEKSRYMDLGSDLAGYHWFMTTTTEPMGNALGVKANSKDVTFGDNAIVNGNLHIDQTNEKDIQIGEGDMASGGDENDFYVNTEYSREEQVIDFNDNLKIYGRLLGQSMPFGRAKYEVSDITFESLLKYTGTGYYCPLGSCFNLKYKAENIFNFFDKYDNRDEEFVKTRCCNLPLQPYIQYKIIDYRATSTEGRESGVQGTVRCMEEDCHDCKGGTYVPKPPIRDNISCMECGDSFNSRPFGCQ